MRTAQTPAHSIARGTPPAADDLRLVEALLNRDRKASAEFIERYSDVLYGYLRSRLAPRVDLAEDYLQEVFLAAWQSLPNYEGRSSLKSWLLGIARHKVEGHYRSRLKEPAALTEEERETIAEPGTERPFEELLDHRHVERRFGEVLESLPETYRVVLLWRYWEQRSAQQMAEQSGRSVKSIERLLARAREQFRRRWNDE